MLYMNVVSLYESMGDIFGNMGLRIAIQSISYELISLHSLWPVGRLHSRTHGTTHAPWEDCTLEPIVRPTIHGQIVPQNQLYNICCMGGLYHGTHCTTHGAWADCTPAPIVQCMLHGQIVP